MFGVVLWSSHEDLSAVIWCEDHQDLAILRQSAITPDLAQMPEAGDLVSFDIKEENGVREAWNTVVVAPDHFVGLPGELKRAGGAAMDAVMNNMASDSVATDQKRGQVVPFPNAATLRPADRNAEPIPLTGTGR
ncbi:hypothetical protein [Pseudooceanicola sp.]|uniref:hypothetical protein n=1 Tax=Pseudooceanicola sp. TaxID=1914328 RepID=UPI0035C69952